MIKFVKGGLINQILNLLIQYRQGKGGDMKEEKAIIAVDYWKVKSLFESLGMPGNADIGRILKKIHGVFLPEGGEDIIEVPQEFFQKQGFSTTVNIVAMFEGGALTDMFYV